MENPRRMQRARSHLSAERAGSLCLELRPVSGGWSSNVGAGRSIDPGVSWPTGILHYPRRPTIMVITGFLPLSGIERDYRPISRGPMGPWSSVLQEPTLRHPPQESQLQEPTPLNPPRESQLRNPPWRYPPKWYPPQPYPRKRFLPPGSCTGSPFHRVFERVGSVASKSHPRRSAMSVSARKPDLSSKTESVSSCGTQTIAPMERLRIPSTSPARCSWQ